MDSERTSHEGTQHSLPDRLRGATRQKHQNLNTQIIARLPLCLPPHANSPLIYAKGMVVFGQIYVAIEGYLATPPDHLELRTTEVYRTIHLPQLLRTSRLENDIALLKSRLSRHEVEELESLAKESRNFGRRVESSLAARPYTLLAYTWTMYLALFNGGRWIRKQLLIAGDEFWREEAFPLSFWDFDDPMHAVDVDEYLKETFKVRFQEAAAKLTEGERQDVLDEATQLFDLCSEMVELLDRRTIPVSSPSRDPALSSHISSAESEHYMSTSAVAEAVRMCLNSACALLKTTASTAWRGEVDWQPLAETDC